MNVKRTSQIHYGFGYVKPYENVPIDILKALVYHRVSGCQYPGATLLDPWDLTGPYPNRYKGLAGSR